MSRLAPAFMLVAVFAAFAVGCGDDDSKSDKSTGADRARPAESFEQGTKRARAGVKNGEVTIRNKSDKPIDCTVPNYKQGKPFQVADSAAHTVEARVLDPEVIKEVTCQGKRVVLLLDVKPDTPGADLNYLADGTFYQPGYDYLHSHLNNDTCVEQGGDESVDWATVDRGYCYGDYGAGSPPYLKGARGISQWQRYGFRTGRKLPSALRGAPNDRAIKITMALRLEGTFDQATPGTAVECYIIDRTRQDCYTNYREQQGKRPNTEGGPLELLVHQPFRAADKYMLLRGFCQKSDAACHPH